MWRVRTRNMSIIVKQNTKRYIQVAPHADIGLVAVEGHNGLRSFNSVVDIFKHWLSAKSS